MRIVIAVMCMVFFLLSGCVNETFLEAKNPVATPTSTNEQDKEFEGEKESMTIKINETQYEVALDQNETVKDIIEKMPLSLNVARYAGHEFCSELPFVPVFATRTTSEIKAGHVYYWDGWNAFVINYVDYDISPYKVVHIGEIKDKSVCDVLANGTDNIRIEVK